MLQNRLGTRTKKKKKKNEPNKSFLCFRSLSTTVPGCELSENDRRNFAQIPFRSTVWATVSESIFGTRTRTSTFRPKKFRRTECKTFLIFLSFGFLHLVVVASSLLALSSGSLLLSERMTVLVSFSRQSHTGVLQLLEPFFTGSRSEEEGAEAHGPEDRPSRRRVVLLLSSPLELPAIRLEGILLLAPSLVGLLLQYTRNPQQTGRKRKRSSTHRRSPATNKVVRRDFDFQRELYLLLDRSFDYLRASPSNSRDTPLCSYNFAFLEKALKKWRKLPPHRNRKQKNKRTFLESIWLCHVASHTAAQQTILPTWLDNVVSRIDVAAAASISRHAGAHVLLFPPYAIMNVTSKPKRAKFKSFLPCPLPDFGAFSMTNNSVILQYFS